MVERLIAPFVPESPLPTLTAEALNYFLIWEISVDGQENLKQAQELTSTSKEKKLILTPNHLTNADGPAIDRALRERGPKGFADNVVYIQGNKLDQHPVNRYFTKSLKVIKIWPQSREVTTLEEKQQKKKMNIKAMEDAKKSLEYCYYLAVFLEGGRSYDGSLKQAERSPLQLFTLVENSETFALPVGIWGTEKVMPPGKVPRPSLTVNVTFGKPINVSSLIKASDKSSGRMRRDVVDVIMRKGIAPLLPLKYRGVYAT